MADLPVPILEANTFWAIQLQNTSHMFWSELERFAKINYNWNDIDVSSRTSLNKILIAITKKYPDYDDNRIESFASAIQNFSRVKEGDGIIAVAGDRTIRKVGFATNVENFIYSVGVNVSWINEIKETEAKAAIFNSKNDIQKLTNSMLKKLSLPVSVSEDFLYRSATQFNYEIIKPHLKLEYIKQEAADETSQKTDRGGKIQLYYGTNRNKTGHSDLNEYYGDELSDLKFGKCIVNIPKGHTQGEIERPGKFLVWQLAENSKKNVKIDAINELSELDFYQSFSDDIDHLNERAAMVFIHGYNTSFSQATWRTAQIAWDIPFNGISAFYSWPSSGRLLDYLKDIEQSDASINPFQEFIEKLILKTNIEKLHLLAHSMGNRILATTLKDFSNKSSLANKMNVFNQIVLGAADIDQDVFKNNILPQFKTVGAKRTLYASDKDKALNISEKLRRGRPRLGDAGSSLFVENGIDTVDASNIQSFGNNHSYIFDTKELLADLFFLLGKGFDPLDRRLRARTKGNLKYWLFPE